MSDKLQLIIPLEDWKYVIEAVVTDDDMIMMDVFIPCPTDCDNDCDNCVRRVAFEPTIQRILDEYDERVTRIVKYAMQELRVT